MDTEKCYLTNEKKKKIQNFLLHLKNYNNKKRFYFDFFSSFVIYFKYFFVFVFFFSIFFWWVFLKIKEFKRLKCLFSPFNIHLSDRGIYNKNREIERNLFFYNAQKRIFNQNCCSYSDVFFCPCYFLLVFYFVGQINLWKRIFYRTSHVFNVLKIKLNKTTRKKNGTFFLWNFYFFLLLFD